MATDEPAETLAGVGEFAVIDRLVAGRDQPDMVAVGPGDDAAVVVAGDGRTVVSTDMLVAGRHFRLDWSTPHDVGRKAIAQNAADIEAMGAQATAFVVAFGAAGLRCGYGRDRNGLLSGRGLPQRGDDENADDRRCRHGDGGDQQRPRGPVVGLGVHGPNSRGAPRWRSGRSGCG